MANVSHITPRARHHRRVRVRFIVICCLIAAVLMAVLALVLGWIAFDSNEFSENAYISIPADSSHVYTGNGFFYLQNSDLHYDSLEDPAKSWVIKSVDAADVRLAASQTICAIYNRNAIQCLNPIKGDKAFSQEFIGEVLNVRCSNAYVAVLKRDADTSCSLIIYDLAGLEKGNIPLNDQYIMDFGFYGEADMIWTLSLNTKGVSPISILTTYGPVSKALTGIMSLDSQMVEKPLFTESNIFLVSTHYIYSYNNQNKEAYPPRLVYGWTMIDSSMSGAKPIMVFAPRRNDKSAIINTVQLYVMPDESVSFLPPAGTIGVFLSQGRIVCITPTEYYVYNLKGEEKTRFTLDSPIDAVTKLDENHLLLRRGGSYTCAVIK